jgi:hypothetical protein
MVDNRLYNELLLIELVSSALFKSDLGMDSIMIAGLTIKGQRDKGTEFEEQITTMPSLRFILRPAPSVLEASWHMHLVASDDTDCMRK